MTDETPEIETQEATESVSQPAELSPTSTPEEVVYAKEKVAFEAYVKNQGVSVPENFKDVGAWFDSLKNAQKAYTQSRQEVADLKKKYEESSANPNYKAPVEEVKPTEEKVLEIDKLQIPKPEETPVETAVATEATESDWKAWTVEFATKNGLSEETLIAIKKKTKLPDYVIQEYMTGQKAKLEVAYKKAADTIGGQEQLNKVFTWASKSLSATEQESVNAALASPNWEIALLGLTAKYEKAMGKSSKPSEPAQSGKKVPVSATQVPSTAYKTKREFQKERNNPAFNNDPKYRAAVEKRMMMTDFSRLAP